MWFQCLLLQMSLDVLAKRYFLGKQEQKKKVPPHVTSMLISSHNYDWSLLSTSLLFLFTSFSALMNQNMKGKVRVRTEGDTWKSK